MENLGKIFGRLTVKESYVKNKRQYYLCECSCGVIKEIRKDSIIKKEKATRSCGCLKKEQDYKNLVSIEKTHGLTKHRLYKIFNGMKTRCYNEKNHRFYRYGGRGIKIYSKWLENFENFYNWAIENGYENGLSIERIDNDKDYCPSNCKWIEFKEQCKNRKNTIKIEHENNIYCLMDFSKIVKIPYNTLRYKIMRMLKNESKRIFKSTEIIAR